MGDKEDREKWGVPEKKKKKKKGEEDTGQKGCGFHHAKQSYNEKY